MNDQDFKTIMFVPPSHRRSSCARPWREQAREPDRPATHLIQLKLTAGTVFGMLTEQHWMKTLCMNRFQNNQEMSEKDHIW